MTELRRVWVVLTDDEAKELDKEGCVELKTPYPTVVGKVWGFKKKPEWSFEKEQKPVEEAKKQ